MCLTPAATGGDGRRTGQEAVVLEHSSCVRLGGARYAPESEPR